MFAFEGFPATIEYSRPIGDDDSPKYSAEVFGYLNLTGSVGLNSQLVVFRDVVSWVNTETSDIKFLPISDFEARYTNFRLVRGASGQ